VPKKQREQENLSEENDPETQPEIEKTEALFIPEEEESKVPDRSKTEKEPLQDKLMTRDKTMYCTICNKQIEKYGRRKEDFRKHGWIFCPKHGWIQEGIHDKEVVSEQPVRLSVEEVPEEHGEQENPLEGKDSEILPERETPEESSMIEKELKNNLNKATDKTMYCTICNKQIEKYGRRKEDFRKHGWIFCPKHGWIQEGIHDKGGGAELPVRFSIEEVPEEHGEQEFMEVNEPDMLSESDIPETLPMLEEEQLEDLSIERELRMTDLPIDGKIVTRNKSTFISIIISAVFVTVLASFTLAYLVWKSPSNKSLEIKSLKAIVQNEGLTKQVQSQASTPPQESVLVEKHTEEVQSQTSSPPQEAVSRSGKTKSTEKTEVKPLQSQKPSREIFTIQVGAFTDISYAKSLRKRLNRKGYHTYITSSKSKNGGRLYKVWTGKFSNREKTETLSAKIIKTEGIQTFVTPWQKQ
jgi:nitrite reductase/ring-hydroxylating ferredoxin subunit